MKDIAVRWAETELHIFVERELLEMHCIQFGNQPKYNKQ